MKTIKAFVQLITSLVAGEVSVYSTAKSIKGNYSYGKRDFMNNGEYDGEVKR
jgi:hypothetical protein